MYTFKQINDVRKDTEYWFRKPLQPFFALVIWINLNILKADPNTISFFVTIVGFFCGFSFANHKLVLGALFYLLMITLDAVDGATARVKDQVTNKGIFLDNFSGNLAFIFVIIGLIYHFMAPFNQDGIIITASIGLLDLVLCFSAVHFANVTGGKYNFVTKKQVVRSKQTGLFAKIRQVLFKYKIREPFAEKDMLILAFCIGPLTPWFTTILTIAISGMMINMIAWSYYYASCLGD